MLVEATNLVPFHPSYAFFFCFLCSEGFSVSGTKIWLDIGELDVCVSAGKAYETTASLLHFCVHLVSWVSRVCLLVPLLRLPCLGSEASGR